MIIHCLKCLFGKQMSFLFTLRLCKLIFKITCKCPDFRQCICVLVGRNNMTEKRLHDTEVRFSADLLLVEQTCFPGE